MQIAGKIDVAQDVTGKSNGKSSIDGNVGKVHKLNAVITKKSLSGFVTDDKAVAGTIKGNNGGDLSDIIVKSGVASFVELPAGGFYGIGSVTVEGDEHLVPENIKLGVNILGVDGKYAPEDPKLMAGNATIEANGEYTFRPSEGFVGLSRQKVTVNVPTETIEEVIDAKFQSKTVTPGTDTQTITPDEDAGFNALDRVTVEGDRDLKPENIVKGVSIFGVEGSYEKRELQSKTVTPNAGGQTVKPDADFEGLSSVYVEGDTDLIPANIREGVNIFGVDGSYSTGMNYQDKTVTPNGKRITVSADKDFHALAKVTVEGDSKLAPENIADGVTIYGVRGNYVSPMKPVEVKSGADEQYIIPASGYYGFESITVAPISDDEKYQAGYDKGYADGEASGGGDPADAEYYIFGSLSEDGRYEGRKFPALPDNWNENTYRYALIAEYLKDARIQLIVSSIRPQLKVSGKFVQITYYYDTVMMSNLYSSGWTTLKDSALAGIHLTDETGEKVHNIIWTNFDIPNNGGFYPSAFAPLPVYE